MIGDEHEFPKCLGISIVFQEAFYCVSPQVLVKLTKKLKDNDEFIIRGGDLQAK